MVSTKEKESCKKLVKFIVIVTLSYLAFLQIASLLHLYSIKQKTFSNGLSKEDAPIPALTWCTRTEHLVRQEVLDKYKLQSILFDEDDSSSDDNSNFVKFTWRNFDWDSVSLKQLYNEAVIYPHDLMKVCEVGDDYNCTQNEGIYHRWETVLKRSYICSTLRVWKKVPYGEQISVNVFFEGFRDIPVHYQVHDTSKSTPRYIYRYLDDQFEHRNILQYYEYLEQDLITYTVTQEEHLPENEGPSCSQDPTTDYFKCQDDCFEKQLLQDNSSCVLPWVRFPGRQCSSVEEALAMLKKEKEIQIIQCDCQDSCTHFRYHRIEYAYYLESDYGTKAVIDNRNGVALMQEAYLYTFLDLLVNCAGSVGVFFSFSLLWLLKIIIKEVWSLQYFSKYLSSNFKEYLLEYILKAFSLACLSLFLYEGSQLISKYSQNEKTLTIDRLDPLQTRRQNVVICHSNINSRGWHTLPSNYIEAIYSTPTSHMIECHLDAESCMTNGSLFFWETIYSSWGACSMLHFNAAAAYKDLHIIFDVDFQPFDMFLTPLNRIGRYMFLYMSDTEVFSPYSVKQMAYATEQRFNLPPCTESYLECQEACYEEIFLKEDICTPPEMPPAVKHQPCQTMFEFQELLHHLSQSVKYFSLCRCGKKCLDTENEITSSLDAVGDYISELHLSLVPFEFTRTSEDWAYPFNRFIAETGGMLGVLTGMSFLSVLLDSFLKMIAWQSKSCAENSLTKNVFNIVVTFIILGWFLQQAYTTISQYFDSLVNTNKEIIKEPSLIDLPHFIFCDKSTLFRTTEGDVLVNYQGDMIPISMFIMDDLDWNATWSHRENYLTNCAVFGIPCSQQKGEMHEWHHVPNVNRFCLRLEIKPLKVQNYRDHRVVFTLPTHMKFFTAYKEENHLVHLELVDQYLFAAFPGYKCIFTLHRSQYELLEEKPNNCINRLGYNRRNCLDECVLGRVLEKLKCRFPWMKFNKSLPLCYRLADYEYFHSINWNFTLGCQCLPQCHYAQNTIEFKYEIRIQDREASLIEVTVAESKEVFKEAWSYPASQCLADLGGLMSLFLGLTLHDLFLSSDSLLLNLLQQVGQVLNCLGISRVRI